MTDPKSHFLGLRVHSLVLICIVSSSGSLIGCGVDEILYPNREPQCKVGCEKTAEDQDAKPAPGSKRTGESFSYEAEFWLKATPFSRLNDDELGDLLLSNPLLFSEGPGGQQSLGTSMQTGLGELRSLIDGAAKIDAETRQQKPIADCYVKELESLPIVTNQSLEYSFNPGLCFPLEALSENAQAQSQPNQGETTVLAYEDAYQISVPMDQDVFSLTDASEPYAIIHFGRSPAAPFLPLLTPGPRNLRRLGLSHVQLEAVRNESPTGTLFDLRWTYFGMVGKDSSEPFELTSQIDEQSDTVTWSIRGNLIQVNGWSSDPSAPSLGQAKDVAAYGRIVQFNDLKLTLARTAENTATPMQAIAAGAVKEITGTYLFRIPQPGGMLEFLAVGLSRGCEVELFAGASAVPSQSLGVTSLCLDNESPQSFVFR